MMMEIEKRIKECDSEECVQRALIRLWQENATPWEWGVYQERHRSLVVPVPVEGSGYDTVVSQAIARIRDIREQQRMERLWEDAGVPPRYRAFTLQDFAGERGKAKAVKAVKKWLDGEPPMLTIIGPVGVGKTALAAAALKEWVQRWKAFALWRNWMKFIVELQAHFGADISAAEMQQAAMEVPMLVLDDVSAVGLTPWQQSVVYSIIDARYEHHLPTLITSNLSAADLAESVGVRVMDRLTERGTGVIVQMAGRNYRHGGE